MKVLFWGAHLCRNLGGPSLLLSTCRVIRNSIPKAQFSMFSLYPADDSLIAEKYGVKIIGYSIRELYVAFFISLVEYLMGKVALKITIPSRNPVITECRNTDIVIDIIGIAFTDYFPDWRGYIQQSMQLLTGVLLGKPVIKFTQDMGPFENRINKYFARYCLNKLGFILARSERTMQLIIGLGARQPVYVRPDTAFVLEPSSQAEINHILFNEGIKGNPLIGIAASRQVDRRISEKEGKRKEVQNSYTMALAMVADYIIDRLGAELVFIPNEISLIEGGYDDIYVCKKIIETMKNKKSARLLSINYSAPELKRIIGACDVMISSRYHSTVAALSMRVPCLVVGWGFKYEQVMNLTGQGEYVCSFEGITFETIQEKFDALWGNRREVKQSLNERMVSITDDVMSSGIIVKELVEGRYDR